MPKKTQESQAKPAPVKKAVARSAETPPTSNLPAESVQVTCPICGNKETAVVSRMDGRFNVELKA